MGLQTMLYRVWLTIRNFLRRLPTRLFQAVRIAIWYQLRRMRDKIIKPSLGRGPMNDRDTYPQISAQASRLPLSRLGRAMSSSYYELHEPGGGSQLEPTAHASQRVFTSYIPSTRQSSENLSNDSASDSTIPIQILPPDQPPSQSGDTLYYPDAWQGETTLTQEGLLWRANGPSTDTLHTGYSSRFDSENASHSRPSSLKPFASPISALHDISRQSISFGIHGSQTSILISPVARPDLDLPEHQLPQGNTEEVADHIYGLVPFNLKRYRRNRTLPICEDPAVEVRPVNRDFCQKVLPEGWVEHIHPEGRPTFYNEEKRIITESWILDREIYKCLTDSFLLLEDFVRGRGYKFPQDFHLVLDVEEKMDETDQYWCGYYYVSHSTRSIFWLEKMDISTFFAAAGTEVEEARIKIHMEYQYWHHWGLFPNVNELTISILDLMTNHIRDAHIDLLTSPQHTAVPFNLEEINNWATIVRDARQQFAHSEDRPTTWFVGRFMSHLCHSRFHNFYGQYGARLARSIPIRGLPPRRWSNLIKMLSPLLFSAPNVHLKVMEELWVDKLTLKVPWSKFFTQIVGEWKAHTVNASILLNANVALLAIPSNDPGDDMKVFSRTPTQIASYLSVVASSASMLLGLLLLRQYQNMNGSNVEDTNKFLVKTYHPTLGHEALAILYSLPYALLVWSLVTFFLAFFIMCFQDSDAVTRSVVGVACLLAAILVVWCIWMGWQDSQDRWWSPLLQQARIQWKRKVLGRNSCDGEGESTPEVSYSSKKSINWPWLLRGGRKHSTSLRDAESLSRDS
ncbi:hypothetical protein BDZ94DRAFT_1301128 [Collybia nuda]|uniref:WW domain-containing protein n=1 Tax=Collybia nuda TaxID=64659 RepID=A0A9P6CAN8_9AGAR|nr:hypothetical protein BDZ94DRAFT_1301128 [Collybia nuda]